VANDSGGMHLAAAAGARVAGIFGITDCGRTGPLGRGHVAIEAQDARHSRDLSRASRAAEAALRSVTPDRVYALVRQLLASAPQ
jgi:ADP-heptose:LPS heptosyltransferase